MKIGKSGEPWAKAALVRMSAEVRTCILGCLDLYLDVWTCIWMSGLVFGCLDLYFDECLELYVDVWTCIWMSGLVFGCLNLYLDVWIY